MDVRTGDIFYADKVGLRRKEKEIGRPLAPLRPSQVEELRTLGADRRKNYMRNQPCVCGSGNKFKKCCWSDYA
jgi:uncharacterized protein YecA (UPF0149 family)